MKGIALVALDNHARTKGWGILQAFHAFEKQDSEALAFLEYDRMNSQLLNLRAKFIEAGLDLVTDHGGSNRK
ncbi:hypothetical protein SBDP2_170008 [Syntrophobacter sp. SbD2]|nr:hypothetical protein SBDP2_170008 [Syntrophobacter sp. SbD2]